MFKGRQQDVASMERIHTYLGGCHHSLGLRPLRLFGDRVGVVDAPIRRAILLPRRWRCHAGWLAEGRSDSSHDELEKRENIKCKVA